MKKRLAVIMCLVLALSVTFSSMAVTSFADEESKINEKIKDKKQELKESQKKENQMELKVEGLSKDLKKVEGSLRELEKQIFNTRTKINAATEKLKILDKQIEEQDEALGKRLRNMYKGGSIGYLDVLLGSESISDFINNVEMVQRIYDSDKDLLATIQRNFDKVEAKKKELNELNDELKTQEASEEEKRDEIAEAKSAALEKQEEAATDAKAIKAQIEKLNAAKAEITATIQQDLDSSDDGQGSGGTYTGGQFAWPVPGYYTITSGYGARWGAMHYGIDIGAPMGASVVAAASGTVIWSGWKNSFGNTVMISHGSGLYTLYAHNSALVVSAGQTVSRGQTISKIGSTGDSTGPHCHFEVYKGGTQWGVGYQVNPLGYL